MTLDEYIAFAEEHRGVSTLKVSDGKVFKYTLMEYGTLLKEEITSGIVSHVLEKKEAEVQQIKLDLAKVRQFEENRANTSEDISGDLPSSEA